MAAVALNPGQEAAVTCGDGPALVLAGAGSGKTRVIIERMAWLVEERGVDPRHLLALTFTNKAAKEMRQRFAQRLGQERVATWLGTFHSFGVYMLRREIEALGRPKSFTIYDDGDQLTLMKRLVKSLPDGYTDVSPRDALTWISRYKQAVKAPQAPDDLLADEEEEEESYRNLWERYHQALSAAGAVDFDDLLVLVVQLLRDHPELRAKYQRRYRYVLVDEYQDTNRAQYLIARYLSEGHGNLFVVGDEDQSIYSWRGADINNILDFGEDFSEATVYRLEQNYRSTKPILDASNALVAHNINRLGKRLWTSAQGGDAVAFHLAESGEEEARFVVEDMVRRHAEPRETAVLFRTNAQSRLIEEALRKKGINYVLIGGTKFYGRREIKDILAYLRLMINPNDNESLQRVLNTPPRGIGGVAFERIRDYAALRQCSLFQVLREIETDTTLSPRARRSTTDFVQLIDDLALEARTAPVASVVEQLLDRVDYRGFVQKSDEKDGRSRLENIEEFLSACARHDEESRKNLEVFLQDLALVADIDSYSDQAPAVTLMTCHAAKGLEFEYVYLVGLEEGLMPFGAEFDDEIDIEEERRLCYVAMTRARQGLCLSAASSRMLYGKRRDHRRISRFIEEIGTDRLKRVGEEARSKKKKAPAASTPVETKGVKTGTRVRHARFGPGTVMYTEGAGVKLKARIRFDTGRTAKLMLTKAPVEIMERKTR